MQLLEHFKELTLHPKNAQELKGLILQLAVQGNLTKRWRNENPDVEPASVLLEKIEVEKEKLIKAKKIKKEKLEPLLESEFYFDIPNNWEWQRLGNIGFIFNGDSINASVKEAEYSNLESGYPYIATKDVGYIFDPINHENGIRIPFNESKFKIVRKETVLICSEGGSAGKKMGIVNQDCCFGNKLFAIEQYGAIESKFILSLYGSASFSEAFKDNMTGIIGGISRNSFANLCIPIPPLEEQKAIVEVVNQLFAEVEQLEALTKERIKLKADFVTSALNQLTQAVEQDTASQWAFLQQQFGTFFTEKENIKKLREGILQLAVQGKLTRDWRALRRAQGTSMETASTLLEKIKAEKEQLIKERKIKKEKPLPEISEEEIPYELPEGWVWCRLTELTDVGTGSTPAKSNPSYYGGNIPWYTSSATNDEFAKIQDVMITEKALKETNCKVFPQGSLIIAMYGQGKTRGQISELVTPGATNQAIAAMVFFEESKNTKQYLKYYFQKFYHEIRLLAEGGAQPNLNVGKVKETLIPLPPSIEMNAIVEKVNALMTLCDKLEQQIEIHQTTQEEWMQSCLREVVEF